MDDKRVDVAIIGAGTAGLKAAREVAKVTDNFVVIDRGPLGTLCARAGCMPSKTLLQVAADYHRRAVFGREGIANASALTLDVAMALRHVRNLRDGFVASVVDGALADLGDKLVCAEARFAEPGVLDIGAERRIHAERTVIATGSRPTIPSAWQRFAGRILTTDTLFDRHSLPRRIAVLGLGPVGLEIGQALSRLGLVVHAYDAGETIGGLTDPAVNAAAVEIVGRELPMRLGIEAAVEEAEGGLAISAGDERVSVDSLFVGVGRTANVEDLRLERLGMPLDAQGLPAFDRETLQLYGLPVFVAGDVDNDRPVLHEASNEGTIAGYNAVQSTARAFRRKSRLSVCFADPNICTVGSPWPAIDPDEAVTAEARVDGGRFRIMQREAGLLRLYAARADGRLLGAAMAVPDGEHIAHLLAWAHQSGLTVPQMAQMPFYHPTVEELLQPALADLASRLPPPAGRAPHIPPGLSVA